MIAINASEYDYDPRQTRVSMAGNKITVVLRFGGTFSPSGPSWGLDLLLGQFPEGTYEVEVLRRFTDGSEAPALGSTRFTVAARAATEPLSNYTDFWWDPMESGWGLNVIHHGSGKLFASWFVYGPDKAPVWYVIPDGTWVNPTRYGGTIYRATGPYFAECDFAPNCTRPFDPAQVQRISVGSGEISFHPFSDRVGAASFTIDGRTITKLLYRQSF